MDRTPNSGFTLIELLVAIAIAGILLGIGVPSFMQAIQESRISAQYGDMVGSLYLARSEAIKGPRNVTVCPRQAKGVEQCGSKNDWNNGWLVFIDEIIVPGEAEANIDGADILLQVAPAVTGDNTFTAISSSTNSASDAEEVAFIRYFKDGGAQGNSGSVILCDAGRGSVASRAINIVLTGDIRRGRVATGSDAPRDVFNRPISAFCPEPT